MPNRANAQPLLSMSISPLVDNVLFELVRNGIEPRPLDLRNGQRFVGIPLDRRVVLIQSRPRVNSGACSPVRFSHRSSCTPSRGQQMCSVKRCVVNAKIRRTETLSSPATALARASRRGNSYSGQGATRSYSAWSAEELDGLRRHICYRCCIASWCCRKGAVASRALCAR